MLEMFEKLINEHGSSTILKERIELINDKYEALAEKLANAEKENQLLNQENAYLKKQVEELQKQLLASQPTATDLHQEQKAILKFLFGTNEALREELIARALSLDVGILNYHLDALLEKGLLNRPLYTMGNPLTGSSGYREHLISKEGRKYVVEVVGT